MPTGSLEVMAGESSGRRRARATEDPIEQWKHIRCLFYRVYDDLTVAEVARRMGVTERTVERWTQNALGYYGHPEIKVIRAMIKKVVARGRPIFDDPTRGKAESGGSLDP